MKYKTYWRQIGRTLTHNLGRLLAIMGIVALGAGFLAGLSASSPIMKETADRYYGENRYMDFQLLSTMGMTEEDIEAIRAVEGVQTVDPGYRLDVMATVRGKDGERTIRFQSLPDAEGDGINTVTLLEGRMPENDGECLLLLGKLATESLKIGDTIEVEDDGLTSQALQVVGYGSSPEYISIVWGTTTKGNGNLDYVAFTVPEAFDFDVYTIATARVEGVEGLSTYSEEYWAIIRETKERLEAVAKERGIIRYEDLYAEGSAQIADAKDEYEKGKKEAEEEFAKAEAELKDAETQIADGEEELAENEKVLEDGKEQLDAGWDQYYSGLAAYEAAKEETEAQLADALKELEAAEAQIAEGEAAMADAKAKVDAGKAELDEALEKINAYESMLNLEQGTIDSSRAQAEAALAALEEQRGTMPELLYQTQAALIYAQLGALDQAQETLNASWESFNAQKAEYDAGYAQWLAGYEEYSQAAEEFAAGKAEVEAARAQYEEGKAEAERQLQDAKNELDAAYATLTENQKDYEDGLVQLEEGRQKLEDAKQEVADGWAELEKARKETDEKLQDAADQIEDAEKALKELPKVTWYVLDREQNESYVSYDGDSNRMKTIASVFPWMFFVVAALVSLTTMTRMIEEERLLIGTYKALGFSKGRILAKYLIYAGVASLIGDVIGIMLGFEVLPRVICYAYNTMYLMPAPKIHYFADRSLIAGGTALACTLGATTAACLNSLRAKPAQLMQPAAPKAGRKIFLEHIRFIWKRLSFIWKVTMRNLFRYQKRFWMTIIGIAGCTGLMLTGFGIKDSVMDIVNNQFYVVYDYDGSLGVGNERDLRRALAKDDKIEDYIFVHDKMIDIRTKNRTLSCFLYVPEDETHLNDFITFSERESGKSVSFTGSEIVITEKAASILGLSVGDTIEIPSADGTYIETEISGITQHYLRNYVYVPRSFYEKALGYEEIDYTGVLFKVAETSSEEEIKAAYTDVDYVSTVSFMDDMIGPVKQMLSSLDMITLVLIISAAALAFIVLYNLTNINIIERERELATIKVLGFQPGEVCAYIYRETTLLTIIGTVLGLFAGIVMHRFVISTVEVDYVMFGRTIHGIHFLVGALLTIGFSAIVDFVMYFRLKKIDMVESLKSVD